MNSSLINENEINAFWAEPLPVLNTAHPQELWSLYQRWCDRAESARRRATALPFECSARKRLGYVGQGSLRRMQWIFAVLLLLILTWVFLSLLGFV